MKHLLVIAHGSRRQASNDEVRQLSERLAKHSASPFEQVSCAFLEIAAPSIADGIKHCVDNGANEIVVLPYFLSAGRHVSEDIPGEVDQVKPLYPHVTIHLAAYLGSAPELTEVMMQLASHSSSGCSPHKSCTQSPTGLNRLG